MRAFISDLDGTVLDVRERTAQAQHTALLQAGYDVELERIRKLNRFSLQSRDFLNQLNIQLSRKEFRLFIRNLQHAFYAGWFHSRIVPGAFEAIRKIRSKTKVMRLITSRSVTQITRLEVRRFKLDELFDKVITRADLAQSEGVDFIPMNPFVAHRKRLIQLALNDVNPNGDVWVIGDTAGELEAAKNLGFIAVGVLSGVALREDLEPFAHHILDTITEIGSLII